MTATKPIFRAIAVALLVFVSAAPALSAKPAKLEIAKIYIEYNASANDLGFHVFLDGEDWKNIAIVNPRGTAIFMVEGSGPYEELGMTELFFEGAEPSLDEVPLDQLLGRFPEGRYRFTGDTVDGNTIGGSAMLSHAVPAAPVVSSQVVGNTIIIRWNPVVGTPAGFPARPINVVGYQVLVDPFEVTLPASSTQVTLPPEFAATLSPGAYPFEVLAIEASGNQTITEGSFVVP